VTKAEAEAAVGKALLKSINKRESELLGHLRTLQETKATAFRIVEPRGNKGANKRYVYFNL
jgi:hypothetical protein